MKPISLRWKGRDEGAGSGSEGRGLPSVHNYIYSIFVHRQQIPTKWRTFQAFLSFEVALKSVDISGYSETNSEFVRMTE